MPNIRTFEARPQRLSPNFTASEFNQGGGETLQAVGRGIGELSKAAETFTTQRQISRLNRDLATTRAELTNRWRETIRTADPDDPDTAKRFMEEQVGPALMEAGKGNLTGRAREYFDRVSTGINADFLTRTDAGQVELAGIAEVQNFDETLNQMSNAVAADPASFDGTVQFAETTLNGLVMSGSLSREDALRLKPQAEKTIAMSAIRSLASTMPEVAETQLAEGRFNEFLNGQERQQALEFIQAQKKAMEQEARRERENQANFAANDALENMIDPETGQVRVTPDMMIGLTQDPRFQTPEGSDQQRIMFKLYRSEINRRASGGGAPKTNSAVFQQLWDRAGLTPDDPERVTREEVMNSVGRGVSVSDATSIIKRLDGGIGDNPDLEIEKSGFRALKKFIERPDAFGVVKDPRLLIASVNAQKWAIKEQERLLKQGMSVGEIWAPNGPILNTELIRQFIPDDAVGSSLVVTDPIPDPTRAEPEVPKRTEGETPEQFLKRIGQ